MSTSFRAFVVNKTGDSFTAQVQQLSQNDLPAGEVLIRIAYSSVNYKDALACIPEGRIVRSYPFVPGIDLSGIVVASSDARFSEGDKVIVTGYDLGVSHYGGFSEYARVKADWIVPLPEGLTLKDAMTFGTAGFEAALALDKLEKMGLKPEQGPVLVTGATGGVGSMAVGMLAKRGYTAIASTGKTSEHAYLKELGASNILSREEVSAESNRPLEKELWAGSIDSVGGSTLAYLIRTTKYGGSVAACGLTGGTDLHTTVFPFILRGVNLLGIDSVFCPMDERRKLWQRMATDLKPAALHSMINEVTLDELPQVTASLLKGEVRGRTVVQLSDEA
ncbi:MAG TPA: oxidoreductase [Ktedonobacteraceae bacterium]|jgi:putative YhdH/YhfP family quinone oxidoreductase|nr:oxidoreductase [Ktedonobacteraceae bacterium]